MLHRKALVYLFFLYTALPQVLHAQKQQIADSIEIIYRKKQFNDTARFGLLYELSFNELSDLEKGVKYADELIALATEMNSDSYLRIGYFLKGTKKRMQGRYEGALDAYFKSLELAKKLKNQQAEGQTSSAIADVYSSANNYTLALDYYRKAINSLTKVSENSLIRGPVYFNMGEAFLKNKNYDSAFYYTEKARQLFVIKNDPQELAYCSGNLGMIYAGTGKKELAEKNIQEAIGVLETMSDYYPICVYLIALADMYLERGQIRVALDYTLKSLDLAEQYLLIPQVAEASLKLSEIYEKEGNTSMAYRYYRQHIVYRDSVNNNSIYQKMADLRTDFELSQNQIKVNWLNKQKRNQTILSISLGTILLLALIILVILSRNNKNRQKAYAILNRQKELTELQKAKAEEALAELKLTQKNLIQSEKMASLGELTAGIAHELKNPLNFVNNFSEVSVELLDELKEETFSKLSEQDKSGAAIIFNDISDNLNKIITHGKRADDIVKGMLQHARPSTGKKEPTDISALADEYLRLSYHGLSATDKAILNNINKDFDESLAKADVVPQEIGRVLLNLFGNAFYSVIKKKEQYKNDYEPLISVATKRSGNYIALTVKDNGLGISQQVIEKIFQPFFTTKPTGQGTGLGLSISYDIIKAHNGELKVTAKEGEFAEFTILLPMGKQKDAPVENPISG